MSSLRAKWRDGRTTLGGWLSVPSVVTAELVARSGVDYVCVDLQHGVVDYGDLFGMVQAIELGDASPVVRVPWNEPGIIGKVLDAGAEGVIVPMIEGAADAEAAVRACRYPPAGARSWAAGVATSRPRTGGRYREWTVDHVAVIPMIETAGALAELDAILAVPGVDAAYVGPSDLSIALGLPPGNNDGEAAFDETLTRVTAACAAAGVVAAVHSTGALAATRAAAGFRMITVATDAGAMRRGLAAELDDAGNVRG